MYKYDHGREHSAFSYFAIVWSLDLSGLGLSSWMAHYSTFSAGRAGEFHQNVPITFISAGTSKETRVA